ncbi:MarR family transcriptional regulator [Marine Group I thaumarchaeote]|uniref:MarR family transcriptional regulator n=1 Tax=Marine Group I thaumarchaeote TaxID=2511932 RepID=A0A7K4NTX5_9ARCH|nr:MarR family transcriptional regulator [Marine Group I thaumarchaeote]
MNLQQKVAQKHQSPGGEMLLVRNTDILSTMVRIPIVVIGLVLVALSAPIQQSFGSSRTLDFTIYPDGSTHVFYELDVDPLELEITVELFGETIENITITDEDGFLLSNEINHNLAVIETFGASHISIDYDTQDLVSKTGKIWAFTIDAPVQYSLLTPKDSVIIEMSNFPLSMQVENEQSHLTLPPGQANISYYISTLASAQSIQPTQEDSATDNSSILVFGVIAAVAIVAAIIIIKRKSSGVEPSITIQKDEQPKPQSLDPEEIFKAKQDLREDDKEIINFISANGGQAYESELRKKFLQPRTTMWRAVKRLERQGIVEVEKKDEQNIVKLTSKLEDPDE